MKKYKVFTILGCICLILGWVLLFLGGGLHSIVIFAMAMIFSITSIVYGR
jgi:hypothetical protein